MGVCLKCHEKWAPRHRCKPGAIHRNMRNRIKDGESAVHLVSCLTNALEDENESEEDEAPIDTGYGEHVNEALKEFDSYHISQEPEEWDSDKEDMEAKDKAMATHHLSLATSPGPFTADEAHFLLGDEEQSLNFAARK